MKYRYNIIIIQNSYKSFFIIKSLILYFKLLD